MFKKILLHLKILEILRGKLPVFPSFLQWKELPKILTKKEGVLFFIFFVLFLTSAFFLSYSFYFKNTEIKPSVGGKYLEGVVGYPRFINPIYAVSSDVDRDLTELVFSGLMKYDSGGEIIPDLAESLDIKEDGKIFEIALKKNVLWHDGKELTADDVSFTVGIIQNPDYKSPLRASWLGVEVEKINNYQLKLKLKNPYPAFLERLTLKIMPKHVWQDILPQNFPLAIYNLQPIGSGPYRIKSLKQDNLGKILSLDLAVFGNYFGKSPNLPELSFYFFDEEEELVKWALETKQEPRGVSIVAPANSQILKEKGFDQYSFSWPRYFALFFNQKKSKILAQKELRQGLTYALDKMEIMDKVLMNQGEIADSPILPQMFGFNPPSKTYEFAPEKAEELFKKAGFEKKEGKWLKTIKEEFKEFKSDLREGSRGEEVKTLQACLAKDKILYPEGEVTGNFGPATKKAVIKFQEKYAKEILEPQGFTEGTGLVGKSTRAKLNEFCAKPPETLPLKFSLSTVEDPVLEEVAENLKEQWERLGIEVQIEVYPISTLEQEIIKPRNYESLLFGEVLGIIPDPFPFWHSSQKKDPGLNLAAYESKEADKLLEDARINIDFEARKKNYENFQDILLEDAPAVFLYSPKYFYFASGEVKGIKEGTIVDPSKRFSEIGNWYIKTKRVWK